MGKIQVKKKSKPGSKGRKYLLRVLPHKRFTEVSREEFSQWFGLENVKVGDEFVKVDMAREPYIPIAFGNIGKR